MRTGVAVFFATTARWIFFVALVCIGTGWNFNYATASKAVLATFTQAEKATGQGLLIVFTLGGLSVAMVTASFTYIGIGWQGMYAVRFALQLHERCSTAGSCTHWVRVCASPCATLMQPSAQKSLQNRRTRSVRALVSFACSCLAVISNVAHIVKRCCAAGVSFVQLASHAFGHGLCSCTSQGSHSSKGAFFGAASRESCTIHV